jgi:hypothetical protein
MRGMYVGHWWTSPMEGDHSEGQGVVASIILKWILGRCGVVDWIDLIQELTVEGPCEHNITTFLESY